MNFIYVFIEQRFTARGYVLKILKTIHTHDKMNFKKLKERINLTLKDLNDLFNFIIDKFVVIFYIGSLYNELTLVTTVKKDKKLVKTSTTKIADFLFTFVSFCFHITNVVKTNGCFYIVFTTLNLTSIDSLNNILIKAQKGVLVSVVFDILFTIIIYLTAMKDFMIKITKSMAMLFFCVLQNALAAHFGSIVRYTDDKRILCNFTCITLNVFKHIEGLQKKQIASLVYTKLFESKNMLKGGKFTPQENRFYAKKYFVFLFIINHFACNMGMYYVHYCKKMYNAGTVIPVHQ